MARQAPISLANNGQTFIHSPDSIIKLNSVYLSHAWHKHIHSFPPDIGTHMNISLCLCHNFVQISYTWKHISREKTRAEYRQSLVAFGNIRHIKLSTSVGFDSFYVFNLRRERLLFSSILLLKNSYVNINTIPQNNVRKFITLYRTYLYMCGARSK